ncbi:MAG: hypothetical protein ED559_12615 [Phycisphaera sp.]|nr:MAG: hypothetical protein ED559_12615 [Phycisphaera sp.]
MFTGCAARAPEPTDFIGTWQYDRVSLKDEALLSAIDSASGGEPESLSDEELAEVVAWVDENHATWDKSIIIEPDGRFKMISRVGDGRAEIIEGKWQQDATGLRLLETDGQEVAFALLSGNRLELAPSGDDTGSGVMVMERTAD